MRVNETSGATPFASWYISGAAPVLTISESTFTLPTPIIEASRTRIAKDYRMLQASVTCGSYGRIYRLPHDPNYNWSSTYGTDADSHPIYMRDGESAWPTVNTSNYFNENNASSRTAYLTWRVQNITVRSAVKGSVSSTESTGIETTGFSWETPITLNAPPTFTVSNVSFNESYHVAGHTKASVTISNLSAKYGGTIKSVVLKIGNQTASGTGNGPLSITCNAPGTFTPTVTVTDSRGQVTTKSLASITINTHTAPTFTASNVSFNESYHVAGHTTASTTISGLTLNNGTTLRSMTFEIGNVSVPGTGNGPLSINCNIVGTFTPKVTVTDSWGATTSKNLAPITINAHTPPTVQSTQVSFVGSDYANYGRAKVTISQAMAYQGASIATNGITLKINSQTASISDNGDIISPILNTAGKFTPTVTITDNWGGTYTLSPALNPITIRQYMAPSINSDFTIERVDANKEESDEGCNAVISMTITYSYEVEELQEPSLTITKNGVELSGTTVTWYTNEGLTNAISDWTAINNNTRVYGFITDSDSDNLNTPFDTQYSYNIIVTPRDTKGTGNSTTMVLPAAYYTVDFLAGGHGIAFGQPSAEEGFVCNMDSTFNKDLNLYIDNNALSGTVDRNLYNALDALGWT